MRALAALALASFAPLAALPAQQPKSAAKDAPTVAGELGRKLDRLVQQFDRDGGGFSGSVMVAKGGKVLLEKGYGLHDADGKVPIGVGALWDWASVSKQFTAAALLRLQDEKKLDLDDALAEHWPQAPDDKKGVTVRMLLNHTSGIESGFKQGWHFDGSKRESFEQCVLTRPMTSAPGEKFEYSNACYALAAALVERLTGDSFEKFCVDELFRPCGMQDACFIGWQTLDLDRVPRIDRGKGFADKPKDLRFAYGNQLSWGYRGCGGTVASTRDMLAWDRALRGGKLLSKQALEELYAPAKDGYALGWRITEGKHGRRAEHSGSVRGVITAYVRLLDQDVIVAIACNYEPKQRPDFFAGDLIDAVMK